MRISDWSSDVCSSDLRTRPLMLDFELGFAHVDLALVDLVRDFPLFCGEGFGPAIFERADRNDGKARVDLDARHLLARPGVQEIAFAIRMRAAFVRPNQHSTTDCRVWQASGSPCGDWRD